MRIAMIALPAWANWAPMPALLLLAAQLRRAGHEVELFDLNVDLWRIVKPKYRDWWLDENSMHWVSQDAVEQLYQDHQEFFDDYVARVAKSSAGLVALSINSGARYVAPRFATHLRQHLTGVPFVAGGPDCFRSYFFTEHLVPGVIDALCPGEGELALVDLARSVEETGRIPVNQPGFVTWEDGEIRDNGDPERPRDLDALAPISLEGVDLSRYALTNRVTMSISRGCVRRCAFCSEGANFWKFRSHSAHYMVEQLEALIPEVARSGDTPYINFNDSLINGNMGVLEELCDLILERGLAFTWGGMAIIRPEMTFELMSKMHRAGCVGICWGIESGSGKTLSLMRKGITPSLMDQVIREAHAAGLKQYGNLMIGFPGEGPYEFAESLLFAVKNARYFECLGLPVYMPERNSTVYKMPEHFGMADLDTFAWSTTDQTSTPAIRVLRRALLSEVLADRKHELGMFGSLEANHGIDLSDPLLLGELQAIMRAYVQVTQGYLAQASADLPLLVDRFDEADKKGPAFPRGQLRRDIAYPALGAEGDSGADAQWMTVDGGRRPLRTRPGRRRKGEAREISVAVPPPIAGWEESQAVLSAADELTRRYAVEASEADRDRCRRELEETLAQLLRRMTAAATGAVRIEQALPQARELVDRLSARQIGGPPAEDPSATVAQLLECVRSAFEWAAADTVAVRLRRAERELGARLDDSWGPDSDAESAQPAERPANKALARLEALLAPIRSSREPLQELSQAFGISSQAFVDTTWLGLCLGASADTPAQLSADLEAWRELVHGFAIAAGAYLATSQSEQLTTLSGELQGILLPAWDELRLPLTAHLTASVSSAAREQTSPEHHTRVNGAMPLEVTEELEAVLDDLWDGLKPQLRLATADGVQPIAGARCRSGARLLDPHMISTVLLEALHAGALGQVLDSRLPGGSLLLRSEAWASSGVPEAPPSVERLFTVLVLCGTPEPARVTVSSAAGIECVALARGDALVLHEGTTAQSIEHEGQLLLGHFCAASQDVAPCYGHSDARRYAAPGANHEYSSAYYELLPDGEACARDDAA